MLLSLLLKVAALRLASLISMRYLLTLRNGVKRSNWKLARSGLKLRQIRVHSLATIRSTALIRPVTVVAIVDPGQ